MKKLYLPLLLLLSFYSNAQNFNGNFENWAMDPVTGLVSPQYWTVDSYDNATASVVQDIGRTGNYCAKIVTTYDFSSGSYYGGSMHILFLVSAFPTSLSGYWKVVNPIAADNVQGIISVYDQGMNQLTSKSFYSSIGVAINNWTAFNTTIPVGTGTPNLVRVELFTNTNPTSHTLYASFDDLVFTFPTGIDEMANTITNCVISPTVNNGSFKLDVSSTGHYDCTFSIYDATGRLMTPAKNQTLTLGNHQLDFNVNLANGVYFLTVDCSKGKITRKFIVQN